MDSLVRLTLAIIPSKVRGKDLANLVELVQALIDCAPSGEIDYVTLKEVIFQIILAFPDISISCTAKHVDVQWIAGFVATRIQTILAHARRLTLSGTKP